MRAAYVALLLLLTARPATAGPWDEYQLIMWQERTPAQIEGLKRLGFTGTKLRATGGEIDAAELAHHRASGLPWYLENIATDFYAPYHRFTPGKAVNWLFGAAKARRNADPADAAIFAREPSLSDLFWLERVQARLEDMVRRQAQFRPLFYNLADEPGIGDLAAAWDADTSAPSLSAMRTWLQTQYPSLTALNAQWETRFAAWDEVVPELTDQAMRRTDDNYSAWADFKAWMDVAFARAVRAGTDAVHRAQPDALAGLEGAQLPGWGGYDYSLLAPSVDVIEIYDYANALDLAYAFAPGLIALRTSFGGGAYERHGAWHHLLHGGRGTIVWDDADTVVTADGVPGTRGLELGALTAALREIAPLMLESQPDDDKVAVLVSQASFRTRWMLDHRPEGPAWSDRNAAREYEDNSWRAARREVLERLAGIGVQPRLLSSAVVEAGGLRDGVRVLILPHCIALSPKEAEEIASFKASGGTVLADTEPGRFDAHSRLLPRPSLAGVVTVEEAMLRAGTPPSPSSLAAIDALLRAGGVTPRARFLDHDGLPATGLDVRWLRHGGTELLAIQTAAPYPAPAQIDVELADAAPMRAVRGAMVLKRAGQATVILDPVEPTILSIER